MAKMQLKNHPLDCFVERSRYAADSAVVHIPPIPHKQYFLYTPKPERDY